MRTGVNPGPVVLTTDVSTPTSAQTGGLMHKSQDVGRIASMPLSQGVSPTARHKDASIQSAASFELHLKVPFSVPCPVGQTCLKTVNSAPIAGCCLKDHCLLGLIHLGPFEDSPQLDWN